LPEPAGGGFQGFVRVVGGVLDVASVSRALGYRIAGPIVHIPVCDTTAIARRDGRRLRPERIILITVIVR
jgi:hypothetical protein